MNRFTQKLWNCDFIRVSKTRAKTLYNMGFRVIVAPCNLRLNNPWGGFCELGHDSPMIETIENGLKRKQERNKDFEKSCNAFAFYNCNNEMGRYLAFYIPVFSSLHFQFADGSNPYFVLNKTHETIIKEITRWAKNWNITQMRSLDFECFYGKLSENKKGAF